MSFSLSFVSNTLSNCLYIWEVFCTDYQVSKEGLLLLSSLGLWGFPGGAGSKEPACQCRRHKRHGFNPWARNSPWRRAWQPTPVFLPEGSHGQRSLAGYMSKGQRVRHDWSDLARTLCYALGPCCLRVLYIVVFICYSQTPTKFIPFGKHKSIFYVCKSICIL